MPPKSTKPTHGLGRAIINQKVKDARRAFETGEYHTTDFEKYSRLNSVTQERDLDEFLNTAQLAGTEFIAEKQNIKIIQAPSATASSARNPFLLTVEEELQARKAHEENKSRLRVPRRPPWTKSTPHVLLERQEKDAFLTWRRGLADLQESSNLLLTPFERNLELWRQLWRVLERSQLIVQIVDARNPLAFRCEDLETYIKDIEGPEGERGGVKGIRKSLLLINKADLLTPQERRAWADYFEAQGVKYAFFSAANAAALQEAARREVEQETPDDMLSVEDNYEVEQEDGTEEDEGDATDDDELDADFQLESQLTVDLETAARLEETADSGGEGDQDITTEEEEEILGEADEDHDNPRTRVMNVFELEELFIREAPDLSLFASVGAPPPKLTVGLVGYPNVGKSSTINTLIGSKKVSVSSTPGKTKHFQTIHLSSDLILCDCPGLVFPQFATTKADLVCDGVLPIDQMREWSAPVDLVVRRIPRDILEATYGLALRQRGEEELDRSVTAEDLLIPYAIARGFARAGKGEPDEARAARYILKDYVNGKLLYCHPPPGTDSDEFNSPSRRLALARLLKLGKKKAPTTRVGKDADTFVPAAVSTFNGMTTPGSGPPQAQSGKSIALDRDFFSNNAMGYRAAVNGRGAKVFPHQRQVGDDGRPLNGQEARIAIMAGEGGTKHHKVPKRAKQRSGKGYD